MASNDLFRKTSLERISSPEKLNDYIKVSNPSVWMVILALCIFLGGFLYWSITGSMPTTIDSKGVSYATAQSNPDNTDMVVCFLSVENTTKLTQAMSKDSNVYVKIYPKNIDTNKYGYISGTVKQVDTKTTDAKSLESFFDSYTANEIIPENGTGVQVVIKLDHDSAVPKDLNWSNSKDTDTRPALKSNYVCDVKIITEEKSPISFLLG